MATERLTNADIARVLHLPESTVRYYRDHFGDYIPVIGAGRQRRYPAEAVEVFRVIADTLRKDHGSAMDVEATLSRLFPRNAVITAEPQQTTAEQQQSLPQLAEQLTEVLRQQQDALARQHAALAFLTHELADLKSQLAARDEAHRQRLEERDRALVATMRQLLETRQPLSLWQRLFGAKKTSARASD